MLFIWMVFIFSFWLRSTGQDCAAGGKYKHEMKNGSAFKRAAIIGEHFIWNVAHFFPFIFE